MSRGHIQGYDSNAAQFARMGDPWVTERDRHDLGNFPENRKVRRQNRQVRPCDRPYPEPRSIGRPPTPEEERAARQRAMLAHVGRLRKQLRGDDVREVAGYRPVEPPVVTVKPLADKPVSEWAHEKIAGDLARLAHETRRARIEAKVKLGDLKAAAELELGVLAL